MIDKGKRLLKKSAFYGEGKITNKAVKYVDALDERGVVNTASKRRELYNKFKEYGRKGRGLTEAEAKMALAEFKYGHNDRFTKKSINILADEMGIGRGKITKKQFAKAQNYKQKTSYIASNRITRETKNRVDSAITARREGYAKKIHVRAMARDEQLSEMPQRTTTMRRDVRSATRATSPRQNSASLGEVVGKSPHSSVRPRLAGLAPSRLAQRSSSMPGRTSLSPLSRLSGGLGGRFGSSHRSISRLR